ncbi:MAG: aminopeptidase [Anaerolineales bacterium]|nr:MAG: aminopeptidase [Anaerolineales bacterium]
MIADSRIQNLAKILVHYSTQVQAKDRVMIRGFPLEPSAEPLVMEVVREVLRAGGYPHLRMTPSGYMQMCLSEASDHQLEYIDPLTRMTAEDFEVDIRITSTSNTRGLGSRHSQKMQIAQKATRDLIRRWMQRSAAGELRWVATRYPTNANAQDAEMSLPAYLDFFYRSCFADQDDPVTAWKEIERKGHSILERLRGRQHYHLRGPDIDLKMSLAERTLIVDAGQNNIPDGEIFTGPVEDSVEGWVRFSYPCIRLGTEVDGVELTFKAGKVIQATATKNEAFLLQQLDLDAGARVIGELGIGLNHMIQRFTKNMLFDEKIAGTIHLALGAGYPESGSLNTSVIHWDMLVDMRHGGQITADDELIYENGAFIF